MKKKIVLMITMLIFILCSISLAQEVGDRWPENFDFMLGDYSVEIKECLDSEAGIEFNYKNVLLDGENVCLVGEIIISQEITVKNIILSAVIFNEDKIILKILDLINTKPDKNIIKFKHIYPSTTDYRYIIFSVVISINTEKKKFKVDGV